MTQKIHGFLPVTAEMPSDRQRLFVAYLLGALVDLVVLNLFDEYSDKLSVHSFTISLLAAVLLQALLKLTIAAEHWVAQFFKARAGGFMTFMRWFCAWLVLFGSKFVILEALALTFGDSVRFEGMWHGLVTLIIVVVTMLIAEEAVTRLFRKLA